MPFVCEPQLTRVVAEPDCNIIHNGPTQRRKCLRCGRGKHACILADHNNIVPALNMTLRARATAVGAVGTDREADAQRTLDEAQEALKTSLRMKANYSSAAIGDKPTPRKRRAGAPSEDGLSDVAIEELQTMRNSINAIAQAAREVCTALLLRDLC